MSQDEYNKMVASGKVQMSGDNKVHVANPADINAFGKQAPKVLYMLNLMFLAILFRKVEQMAGKL